MVDCVHPSQEQYRLALRTLEKGGIVAYPTETFYGLAVDPGNEKAVSALYRLKKRDHQKPLSLLVTDKKILFTCIRSFPQSYTCLIDRFWPGPLTLIFPAHDSTSLLLRGGGDTLAIRISSHPVARKLCALFGGPITATSANESGHPPLLNAAVIMDVLGDRVDYVLDGGSVPGGKGSTMVEIVDGEIHVIRHGVISADQIFKVCRDSIEK